MNLFEMAKNYYERGLWDRERLRNLVIVNVINGYQYELITGEKFG